MNEHLYIGLMSGTSMDAIDAVLVAVDDQRLRTLHIHSEPYPAALSARLTKAVHNDANPDEIGRLDRLVGEAFASCALGLLEKTSTPAAAVSAIGSHGQTLRHAPEGDEGFSLQIGSPSVISERTGITTVADFRGRDIAAGGQGAPLVPAFHGWYFGSPNEARVLLNLGGIANITLIGPKGLEGDCQLSGFDTGPANTLLDSWCMRHQGLAYDAGGRWARSGAVNQALLVHFLADAYFQRPPPKSTGREHFNMTWLSDCLGTFPTLAPRDVQRTLLELTAITVAEALHSAPPAPLFICGGGSRNDLLLERITALMPQRQPRTTAHLGLAPDAVEGAAFAWLAKRTLDGLAGNNPASTGARGPRVLGGIYPADRAHQC